MTQTRRTIFAALLLLGAGSAMGADDVEARLERIERLLDSGTLVDMAGRLDAVQRDVRELRGLVEQQQNTIEQLRERQRDLYLDLDRRLSQLEREGGSAAAPVTEPELAPDGGPQPAAPSQPAAQAENPQQLVAEREAYQKAFDVLRELRYEQAIEAFRSFLEQFPNGRYAHIARYWLGEANYAQRNYEQAIAEYRTLLSNHPGSPKVAEAMLKIGYAQHELGKDAEARTILERLVNEYPKTTEAGQAEQLLGQLRGGN